MEDFNWNGNFFEPPQKKTKERNKIDIGAAFLVFFLGLLVLIGLGGCAHDPGNTNSPNSLPQPPAKVERNLNKTN
jgi:hypothetical protein